MKIALFSDTFAPQVNGVANTVKNSARALSQLGHEVCVYTLSAKNNKELENESSDLFKVITLPSIEIPFYPGERFYLPLGFSIKNLMKFKPDIIHVHTPFSVGFEGAMLGKFFHIPIVGTHHTFFDHYLKHIHLDYSWARKFSWWSTVVFYNLTNTTISPTHSLKDELRSHGLKKPIEILSNSINFQVFYNNKSTKKSTKKLSFVYMGRVSYEKSIDEVIKAAAEVFKMLPESKLMIIGDGPEKTKLEELAKNLCVENNITFTGFLHGQSLVDALLENDIFVTASKSENMPLAVLEAMSVGLPIIAISSLGMSEIVERDGNGFLLPNEDTNRTIKNIANKICTLLNNDKLRESFQKRSIELSLKYSEKETTEKLINIYKKILNLKNENTIEVKIL
jgi:glycosyltransferase involved in cell wall biosynthesis